MEGGNAALWTFFYQIRTLALMEKYPKTTSYTSRLAGQIMRDFSMYQAMQIPPESGGLEQQSADWVMGMELCYAAKSKADEELAAIKAAEDNEGGTFDSDDPAAGDDERELF